MALESCASGSWGAMSGAKMATSTQKTTIASPITATGERKMMAKLSQACLKALGRTSGAPDVVPVEGTLGVAVTVI